MAEQQAALAAAEQQAAAQRAAAQAAAATSTSAPPAAAAAVQVRSPPVAPPRFFEEDPVIWLVQLDLYFSQAAVHAELDKFRIAATLLPGHLLRDFADILRNPPAAAPYQTLANAIRQRFGKSLEQRLRTLLANQQLGDRRPSQLLRHLLDLAQTEGSADSPLVRQIYLNALPARILPFLECLPPNTDLATIASTADRLLELPQPSSTPPGFVGATSSVRPPSPDLPALLEKMIAGIAALTTTVTALSEATLRREPATLRREPFRPRSRGRSGPRGSPARASTPQRSRSPEPSPAHLCWYHRRFGADARSCQPPCSWPGNRE